MASILDSLFPQVVKSYLLFLTFVASNSKASILRSCNRFPFSSHRYMLPKIFTHQGGTFTLWSWELPSRSNHTAKGPSKVPLTLYSISVTYRGHDSCCHQHQGLSPLQRLRNWTSKSRYVVYACYIGPVLIVAPPVEVSLYPAWYRLVILRLGESLVYG